nr:hypothetical protein [uncultured Pseudomonas sp.]
MARPTFDQYKTYMQQAPRTRGWGALLVYDRNKANLLLMQEHILRADEKTWIEPISGEKETENGKFTRLSNFIFGTPVLSFENANIGSSIAALSIPVVGGKLTEWSRPPGAALPTLVGISHLDPLTAPRVKMNIRLNLGGDGAVDEDGRVYIDLSNSSAYYFEVSQWKELNTKLGELIEAQFKAPGRGKQEWELNKLAPVENVLNPTSFRVRTHSLGRAGKLEPSTTQADLEEGSVIVGVAFNGAGAGDFPDEDKDMPYLLPERTSGAPYSLNVILSDEVWAKNVVDSLLAGLTGTPYSPSPVRYETNAAGFYVKAEAGGIIFLAEYEIARERDFEMYFAVRGALGNLSLSFAEDRIDCSWSCKGEVKDAQGGMSGRMFLDRWVEFSGPLELDLSASCSFTKTLEDGAIVLTRGLVSVQGSWSYDDRDHGGRYEESVNRNFALFKEYVLGQLEAVFNGLAGRVEVVDLLRLNGLLFRNGQRSVADTFSSPGDVTMLGDLAPTLTAFQIDPIEKILIAGATQPLIITPRPQPGQVVNWEVKALPADPENPSGPDQLGEIVGSEYKAPKADTISATFRQVIITATVGENSSSALFTIVPKAVAVRPLLLDALFSTDKEERRYVLEGGSIDSQLTWAPGAGFKGELREPTAAEYDELNIPKDKNVRVYVAPLNEASEGPVLGALMQLDQVQVTGAGRTETIDITVAWSPTAATVKVEAQRDVLKLVLTVQTWGGGKKDLPPEETKWFVAKGKGTLDETNGTYKPGTDEGDYVIIAGVGIETGHWNYAVLPIPFTFEEAQVFHEVSKAMLSSHPAVAPHTADQQASMEAIKKAFGSLNTKRA